MYKVDLALRKKKETKLECYEEKCGTFELTLADDTPLIGGESLLDSKKLVELCLALEDKATDLGFEFDWTSDAAMFKSRSMFRTTGSLST